MQARFPPGWDLAQSCVVLHNCLPGMLIEATRKNDIARHDPVRRSHLHQNIFAREFQEVTRKSYSSVRGKRQSLKIEH